MDFHVEDVTEPETIHLERKVKSDLVMKGPLITGLTSKVLELGLMDDSCLENLELCLEEAVINAMVHGNGSDPARQVRV